MVPSAARKGAVATADDVPVVGCCRSNPPVSERAIACPFEDTLHTKAQTMLSNTPIHRASCLLVLALIASGCSSPEEQKQQHFDRGNQYAAEKRDDFAVIEYANAVRIDPKFGEARLKLAETYERMGNLQAAFPEFVRAADALPDNREVQLKATELLLLARRYEDAKARAEAVLVKNPKDVEAMLLRANAMTELKEAPAALKEIEE